MEILILSILLFVVSTFSLVIYFRMNKIKNIIKSKNNDLSYNKKILETIVDIQQELISNSEFNSSVDYILKEVIKVLKVDRVYIFENHMVDNKLMCSQKFEYVKNDIKAELDNPNLQNVSYDEVLPRWRKILSSNNTVEGFVKDFPEVERVDLEAQNIKSILVIPIVFENRWWGFMGFDDCNQERIWEDLEKKVLNIISNSFISALMQDNYYKSLEKKVESQLQDIRKKDNILIQQSKMSAMGEMIGNIAHQWRQPLNIISTSLLNFRFRYESDTLDDKFIENILTNTDDVLQNMSHIIDNFRCFFKPNTKKEIFDIKEIISKSLDLFGESFRVKDITISINCEKPVTLLGYKNEFSQAILVILNNAKDAILEKKISNGKIDIDIKSDESDTFIVIKDNGVGIQNDIMNRIYEPYFTTKFKSQGTGIGLYMVQQIMNNMDGIITASNHKNGAIFTLKFRKITKELLNAK